MNTRERQRTLYPARRVYLQNLVWWHSGSGGQGGLKAQACLEMSDSIQVTCKCWTWQLSTLFFQHQGLTFALVELTLSVSLFLCHCLLLASTVGFIYHFIYLFGGAADGQTSECSQHFFSAKQQRGTNQATFSCHHFQFGCSRNRPTKKSKLVLTSTCQATSQLYLSVFLVASWASDVYMSRLFILCRRWPADLNALPRKSFRAVWRCPTCLNSSKPGTWESFFCTRTLIRAQQLYEL